MERMECGHLFTVLAVFTVILIMITENTMFWIFWCVFVCLEFWFYDIPHDLYKFIKEKL